MLIDRYKIIHVGYHNENRPYIMKEQNLHVVCKEEDFGVIIQENLTVTL